MATTTKKKISGAEAAGMAAGAFFIAILLFLLMLIIAAWPLMLWMDQMNAHVSPAIPAVSYVGAMSMVGFLWVCGWVLSVGAKPFGSSK